MGLIGIIAFYIESYCATVKLTKICEARGVTEWAWDQCTYVGRYNTIRYVVVENNCHSCCFRFVIITSDNVVNIIAGICSDGLCVKLGVKCMYVWNDRIDCTYNLKEHIERIMVSCFGRELVFMEWRFGTGFALLGAFHPCECCVHIFEGSPVHARVTKPTVYVRS